MKQVLFCIFAILSFVGFSQETLSELLTIHNTKAIPYITVQELAMPKTKAIILDARELEEYNVSHIKEAIFVGYNSFQIDLVKNKLPNKNETIVVYCSLGIRSESIANKLKKAGYNKVFNLYGGIFEWKNNNFKVYNSEGKETDNIHAFSKEWSKWLLKGNKVY
ncbi:rhodanese-like domain-containing protein [Aquaticitalea lipolytica]|uniref:rhodanese-like domain-containing protein n=1 Tax=Aquaticitalea lipolytica TaxID=1247562 RepID=UPI0024B91B28|nr:rhodanese-like domain-containing protein [Aquaticitalea lipolytica]